MTFTYKLFMSQSSLENCTCFSELFKDSLWFLQSGVPGTRRWLYGGTGTTILVWPLTRCVTLASYFPSLSLNIIISKVKFGLEPY